MNNKNTSQNNEILSFISDSNTREFYENVIIGQQVYRVLLFFYLFSDICQDIKLCRKLEKMLPEEFLLKSYVDIYYDNSIWSSNDNGINQKIRISYALLSLSYRKEGFDKSYSDFKKAVSEYVLKFIKLPTDDFYSLLKKSIMDYFGINLTFKVWIEKEYSDNDVLYCAKSIVSKKEYIDFGVSKKNATEKLSQKIFFDIFTTEQIHQITKSSHIQYFFQHPFKTNNFDYVEKDTKIKAFSDQYNIEYLLTRFTLLTRSQMGNNIWNNIDASISDFINHSTPSLLKRSFIYLGQEIVLLETLIYHVDSEILASMDISSIDSTSVKISPFEVHERIQSMLSIEKLCSYLYEKINPPINISLTNKDKSNISANFIASLYLSNFSPDIKFNNYFKNTLKQFYSEQVPIDFDYRYALISFFSAFNIRIETNHHEVGNGIFHAEIQIGQAPNSPIFSFENESMRFAKKYIWQLAYNELILTFSDFFSNPLSVFNKFNILFMVKTIASSKPSNLHSLKNIGILDADNFEVIGLEHAQSIFMRATEIIIDKTVFEKFISHFNTINQEKYVVINENVYEYNSVLHNSFDLTTLDKSIFPLSSKNIEFVYSKIINPTYRIKKLLIDSDYKFVSKIRNIDDETAKYAIDCNIDAYNYLPLISHAIEEYYKDKSTTTFQMDIGQFMCNVNDDVKIYILDSHLSVSKQLNELTKEMNINHMVFACGYCFASGLNMLTEIFQRTIFKNIPVEFYVGSLQNYDEEASENIITGIDKPTCRMLNEFLENKNFSLFTCKDRFYHGKIYYFESDSRTLICLGSSNISRSAFISNYELNIAFSIPSDSELKNGFENWINQLHSYSTQINQINESLVGDNEIKMDGSIIIKHVSTSAIQKRINELTNFELQYRLNLWMSFLPDIIAEDLGILALPNYIVFVYNEYKLLVLESFSAGNSYFCIHFNESFEDVINKISSLSKSEIFEYSHMKKRGYHISNKFTLENTIKSYFLKG